MNRRCNAWVLGLGLLVVVGIAGCGGSAAPDDRIPVETPQLPGAPSGLTVTPGDGQVTLTWSAPASTGGLPITRYTVREVREGAQGVSLTTSDLATTVTGLTNGEAYTFTVAATNNLGEGPPSAPSEAVRPRTIPGAPREVTATPGNRQVTVRWSAPEGAGMPITRYTVTVLEGETVVATEETTGTSLDITGLTNGRAYTVTVTAANSVIAGAASGAVVVTPRWTPGAPRVTATPFYARVDLEWTLEDDGGSPTTGYTVTVFNGETLVSTHQTTDTRLSVSGLTNAVTYTFTVRATNALGDGPASEPVDGRPRTVPGRPTNVKASPQDGGFRITFNPPTDDGGSPIFRYRATITAPFFPHPPVYVAPQSPVIVTGLVNGQYYTIEVAAENAAGLSSAVVIHGTSVSVSTPPRNLTATAEDGAVTLSWEASESNGGDSNMYYVITAEPALPEPLYLYSRVYPLTLRVTGLTNGTTYTFSVAALNDAGVSTPVQVQVTPTAP